MAGRTSSPIHANPETFGRETGRWAGFREEGDGRFLKSHLNKVFLVNVQNMLRSQRVGFLGKAVTYVTSLHPVFGKFDGEGSHKKATGFS